LQQQIEAGLSEEEIRNSWREGLREFQKYEKAIPDLQGKIKVYKNETSHCQCNGSYR
jgi:hypothetical protein